MDESLKIKAPSGKLDKAIDLISLFVLVSVSVFVVVMWFKLPSSIPIHFNAVGEVDGYGSKYTMFIMLPIMIMLYFILAVQSRHPETHNYIVTITDNNKEIQQHLLLRLVRVIKLEVMLIFGYIQVNMVVGALVRKGSNLGAWFLPVTLIMIFGTLIIYLYKSAKAK